MKLLRICAVGAIACAVAFGGMVVGAQTKINGAGASFPQPCYQKWIATYSNLSKSKINYQSVGSGAGLAQIKAKTVDFGASDEPLSKEELDKDGLMQFPTVMGGIVLVVHLPVIKPGELKLTGKVLADIFLGKIRKWTDPQIARLNPGVKLMDMDIVVVHRADSSGTTWNFTNYLSKVSEDWKNGPGCGKEVAWPCGLGGQKNAGVATLVDQTKGAIGYVESAYCFENDMKYTQLQNAAGKFVSPNMDSFKAAAANADWKNAKGFFMVLTDQPGDESWPMMAATYILMHKEQADAAKAGEILKFFDWAYKSGTQIAEELNYVPLPDAVKDMVRQAWAADIKAGGQPVFK